MLCVYCETLVEYQRLTKFLNKNGYTIEQMGDKKQILVKMRPEAQLREILAKRMLQTQAALGLTPTSRARLVNINNAGSSDEESEMLSIIGEYPEPAPLKDSKRLKH